SWSAHEGRPRRGASPSPRPPARRTSPSAPAEMTSRPRPPVGYLGPEGTFSEEALLASAAPDATRPVPLATIYEAVMALRRGEVEGAIVPIANSLEGSINRTLHL